MKTFRAPVALLLALLLPLALLAPGSSEQSPQQASDPELPRVCVDSMSAPSNGRTIAVAPGGDFQAALKAAQPGDAITLEAGARFTGNFTLPNKPGTGWITIRTAAPDSRLPAAGTRITPAYTSVLPKLVSSNSRPVITAAPGAHHYRFIGVEFTVGPEVTINYHLILLGNRPTSAEDVPHDLIFDRVYIHGNPRVNLRRGIGLNSARTAIIDSYIAEAHEVGADSQAILGWDGPGPFKIVNNYLEGAGENLLLGGADPSIEGLVPSDIEIRRNHFYKPLWWRVDDPSYAGIHWTLKNLLELKNAQRVLIDANVFENNWLDAQSGTAIVFTVRNQEGTAPWSVVQDVTFTNNIVRHTSGAIGMHGWDDIYPSQQSARFLIEHNLLDNVDSAAWGGTGWLFSAFRGLVDLQIEHNTGFMDQAIMMAGDAAHTGFIYRNNLTPMGVSGFTGVDTQQGVQTLDTYFPGYLSQGNVLAGAAPALYPANNFFPASLATVGFVDLAGGNYRLSAASPYKNAGTDGKDIGADIDAVEAATAGVPTPRDPPPPPTVTRFEETEQAVAYTAGWVSSSSARWSGGAAGVSTAADAQAIFTFTGTSVSWVGFRGPQAGIARVVLDGVLVGDVDLFAPTPVTQVVVFTAKDLAAGRHTLTIEVTGLKNAASTDITIVVDAFEVTSTSSQTTGSSFEETHPSIAYTPGWALNSSLMWSGGAAGYTTTAGARATFTFTGTSVSWIGCRGPQAGIARVSLDGVLVGDVDTYAPAAQFRAVVFSRAGLAPGSHTLTIEATGLKNPASTDVFIVVDRFDVSN